MVSCGIVFKITVSQRWWTVFRNTSYRIWSVYRNTRLRDGELCL